MMTFIIPVVFPAQAGILKPSIKIPPEASGRMTAVHSWRSIHSAK